MNEAALEALRARGAQAFDPVRFSFLQALARRATGHEGEARQLLEARLAQLLASFADAMDAAAATQDAAVHSTHQASPLAELVEHLGRQATTEALPPSGVHRPAAGSLPPELKTLRYFRSTWTRLAADQRLTQALAQVPDNPGPLHSQHLVHRALTLMRELSPDYLQHFMAQVDALLWLEQAQAAPRPPST
jgi:hypothetical protein